MKPATCVRASAERTLPIGGGAGPQDDEDDGEAEDERQARDHDAPGRAALAELAGLDARKRSQVARDERQHARQNDRDEPGGKRDAEPPSHHSKRASTSSRRRSVILVEPRTRGLRAARRDLSRGSSARRRTRARAHRRERPRSAATTRAGRTPCATEPRGSAARSCGRAPSRSACRPAGGDLLRDEALDLHGGLRVGHVERRVAGRAHDLAVEIRLRSARLRAGRSGRPCERQCDDDHRGEPQHHASAFARAVAELAGKRRIRDRAGEMRDDPPLPVEDVRLRYLRDPVAAGHRTRPVLEHRKGQLVRAHEAASIAVEVVEVDAEEDDAASAIARPVTLEHGGLALARLAPRRPEVQHDRLAPVRGQRDLAGPFEPVQRERRRHRAHTRRVLLVRHRQTRSASSPATHASATSWAVPFSRFVTPSSPLSARG